MRLQVVVLALIAVACTNDAAVNRTGSLTYPGAQLLSEVRVTGTQLYEPSGSNEPCPTELTRYGTNDPPEEVVAFLEERGVEDLDERGSMRFFPMPGAESPGETGRSFRWVGERDGDERSWAHAEVGAGSTSGHPEWKSVLEVATSACGVAADATYSIRPRVIRGNQVPTATVTNTGDIPITYGHDYEVHRRSRAGWVPVRQPRNATLSCAFTGEAIFIPPGEQIRQDITVCDEKGRPSRLRTGSYRVTKFIGAEGVGPDFQGGEILLRAFFRVSRSR